MQIGKDIFNCIKLEFKLIHFFEWLNNRIIELSIADEYG